MAEDAKSELERVFREQAPRLHRLALRYHGRADLAEDVVQETFVRAAQGIDAFQRGSELATWLHRIAVNLCLDGVRAERVHPAGPLEAAAGVRGCPGGVKAFEQREASDALREAVARLEPRYRILVVLRDLEGLSYREIARVTGLSVGTISSRLSRARERLSRELR